MFGVIGEVGIVLQRVPDIRQPELSIVTIRGAMAQGIRRRDQVIVAVVGI